MTTIKHNYVNLKFNKIILIIHFFYIKKKNKYKNYSVQIIRIISHRNVFHSHIELIKFTYYIFIKKVHIPIIILFKFITHQLLFNDL